MIFKSGNAFVGVINALIIQGVVIGLIVVGSLFAMWG